MTDWKGAFAKVLKEGKLPRPRATQKAPTINPQERNPPSLKAIFKFVGRIFLFFVGFMIASILTHELMIRFFGEYGDNYFELVFFTESFLLWNWWFFKLKKMPKGYKIASAAICGLLFMTLLTSVTDDNNAISLGYRSADELKFAQSGDFKDQAALDRAMAAGFDKRSELEAAEKAGYHDKASYDKFLQGQKAAADAAQQRQADAQKQAEQAAEEGKQRTDDAAEKADANSANLGSENNQELAKSSPEDEVDANGLSRRAWRQRCAIFDKAKNECAVSDHERSCVETIMGESEAYMAIAYCDGSEPKFYLMGHFKKKW